MIVQMIKTKINDEFEIILPKHRAERPEWYQESGWEKKRLHKMHEVVTNKDVLYYVGAEEGEMPALCQLWGANVVLFEPNKKVVPNIKAIWEANKLKYPLYYAGFASGKSSSNYIDGIVDFEKISGRVISDHGFKELHEPYDEHGEIPQVAISELVNQHGFKYPTIVSIDVEGSEWQVLLGMESLLKSNLRPKLFISIHPEFMFRIYGQYQADLRNWIKDFGYKETILDYQHELHVYYESIND